jgi:Tfp pilus assembly protein PilV
MTSYTLISCSSPSARESRLDVRPGVDGIHRVVVISKNQVEGSREALNQADQYCKEIKKSAYFFNSNANEDITQKNKTSAPVKKASPSGEEAEPAEKQISVDMLFKCL